MSEKTGKGLDFFGAIRDLIIFVLLVGGAAAGGYFVGIQQRLGPIQLVPPGTPGAISLNLNSQTVDPGANTASNTGSNTTPSSNTNTTSSSSSNSHTNSNSTEKKAKTRYWIISSGTDDVGYLIKVLLNGEQVDNFYQPGKMIEVTNKVKSGKNDVEFEAKMLEEGFNKHKGDSSAAIEVKVVCGTSYKEDFKGNEVLLTYKRSATDNQDYSDAKTFNSKD